MVLGGGHGLANMLRGLKAYTKNITAIVSVADDGGGSADADGVAGGHQALAGIVVEDHGKFRIQPRSEAYSISSNSCLADSR